MMFVCKKCFNDLELIGFIQSYKHFGKCDFCKHQHIEIIDIAELYEFFRQLLDNFKIDKSGKDIVSIIQKNWRFFKNKRIGKQILDNVIKQVKTPISQIYDKVTFSNDIIENINHWDVLKNQLKWERRYITNIDYLIEDLGWDGFFNSQTNIASEAILFRARLHNNANEEVHNKSNMFAPPKEKATPGRANPAGIPYLYLCDNEQTVLYEVRAAYLDEITIAKFKLKKTHIGPVFISDFTEIPSLFFSENKDNQITNQIKSTLLKQKISIDLSKPLRRYDSELDYIPTQFICEFIRIITHVGGIKFKSSLHESGNNIVIFDQNIMECIDIQKVKISEVNIKYKST